ncbi:sigma 54-interacting transcriptional regulator [Flammeovirga sp. SR4]|uniref:Sigma 54-interacting transcriptional regulator n=2 Tax=Flammeovirga agarivorans TaxID=2726742 RepID=A0A7X8XW08_9BACT|nr:sigma 54-interacting transcriptional regulator [Flammeovirga agarivorans]
MSFTSVAIDTGIICFTKCHDITEIVQLREQLKEALQVIGEINTGDSTSNKDHVSTNEEKKALLKQLHDLQRHHESILQSAGEGIYGLDTMGRTTFANEAAVKLVGYSLEEMLDVSQHELIHHTKPDGSHYHKHDCNIYASFKDGKVHHSDDEVFWRKDGTSFPVEYVSTPLFNNNNELIGAVVTFKDISHRRETEKALKKTNLELTKALKEVKELKDNLEEENQFLQKEIELNNKFEELISTSKVFKDSVFTKIEQVANTDATVLILGESGTGKELIARAIHNHSNRKDKPLIKVNCTALPANLIESELFGHEKGAFTGAIAKKIGRFEMADGGTLFLDEFGEISLDLQVKLLRVLQEGEIERIGGTDTVKVDVRIIAATNVNLEKAVKEKKFREDLFYRVNVFPIHVPALKERLEDVPLLAQHFLEKYNNQFSKKIRSITVGAMNKLKNYHWPGNVRELQNVIERAVIISNNSKLEVNGLKGSTTEDKKNDILTLAENEKQHVLKILKMTNWRISGDRGAAKILDINRTTLEARMKKLGIKRP